MSNVQRFAAGTLTRTAIRASSAYAWLLFPVWSDQKRPWLNSRFPDGQQLKLAAVDDMVSGKTKGSGFFEIDWVIPIMSPLQLAYCDTVMSWSDTVLSAAATIQTLTARGAWRVFNVTAHRPIEGQDFDIRHGGSDLYGMAYDVRFRFTHGTENTT